jgi:hypothetical protein
MKLFRSHAEGIDEYDKDTLAKINKAGGFIDFGAVGSMPLGYYMDGAIMSTRAYHSARKLIAAKKVKPSGSMSNAIFPVYLTTKQLTGELYK